MSEGRLTLVCCIPLPEFFSSKVTTIVDDCIVSDGVYNSNKKLNLHPENFMTPELAFTAIKSLKQKTVKDLTASRSES